MDQNGLKTDLNDCIEHLKSEFGQIRTGRASAELIELVRVEAYGSTSQLKALANIMVEDAKTLYVKPWDRSIRDDILKSLNEANLGLGITPDSEGIRLKVPDMTEERRREFVKVMKERSEVARKAVRNVRHEYIRSVDQEVESGLSEDEGKRQKTEIEKFVKETNEQIEVMVEAKEADLMQI